MRIILSFFLALGACLAQSGSVHGTISDPSGAVVPEANLTLAVRNTGAQTSARSSAAGEFLFGALAPGEYLLTARTPGGELSVTRQFQLAPGEVKQLGLTLEVRAAVSGILVTAAATPQSVDEISKALDVVDNELMSRRNDYSLLSALRVVPGIRIVQNGGPGGLTRVITRGLRAFDTSVLIDGFRFRDAASPQGDATAFLSDMLVVNTDRVEVLRGSGSSLYGTHSTGGVIQIVTNPGGGSFHGETLAEGGGLGTLRAVAKGAGGIAENRVQYSLGAAHLNLTRGVDGDDRYRNSSAQGWLQWRPAAKTTLQARVFGNDSFVGLNGFVGAGPGVPASGDVPAIAGVTFLPAANDPDSRRSSQFLSTLFSATQQLTGNFSVRGGYQALRSYRDNRNGPAGAGYQSPYANSNRFDGVNDIATARADWAPRFMTLSAGYEFERERYDNLGTDQTPGAARAFTSVTQTSHTAYLQDQFRLLGDRLQISLSGRYQGFRLDPPVFTGGTPQYQGITILAPPRALTGDAAASYFLPSSGTKLRAHAGNGYRAPSLYERFGASYYGGSFSALGDPRLLPERANSFDFGFDQYVAASRIRVSGTYFYTKLVEVIGYDSLAVRPATDPFGRWGGYRNTGGGLARGLELSTEATLTRSTRVQGSYTYARSQERLSAIVGGTLRSPRVPDHTLALMLMQRIGPRLDTVLDFQATSEVMFPIYAGSGSRPFLFPGPRTLNLSVNYDVPVREHLTLRFYSRLENLINQTYYAEGFRTPGFWGVAGLKLLF